MAHPLPRTVEEIFNDFKGHRAGLVKALTVDVEEFYQQCDPGRENLCLYGHPNETWELKPPVEVPPELPDPAVGINFARDGMLRKEWLSLVAARSDSWLISLAVYFCGRFGFGKSDREMLFNMINDYPTLHEVVKNQPPQQPEPVPNVIETPSPKDESESEEEDEEEGTTFCGSCGEKIDDEEEEFSIWCDDCEQWFHGKCVKITPAEAEHIDQFKCPTCKTN